MANEKISNQRAKKIDWKYEACRTVSGNYFIHGGNVGFTHFERKKDAELFCKALNFYEAARKKEFEMKLRNLKQEIESLQECLDENFEY